MQTDFPPKVAEILHNFERSGYQIYIVGGVVRDLLLKRSPGDWDFTTDATPQQILELYPDGFYNNDFGTVGIADDGLDKPYEITTFRTEHGYSDKRRPDKVSWGKTLEEDLGRRDFTVGAIALNAAGKIIDPHAGQEDLQKKIVRTVGNPVDRFSEDSLRMMRAIRIATELGFVIEEETFEAIKMHAEDLKHISWERIRDELFKILASNFPDEGIKMLYASGLLEYILPELSAAYGVEQKSPGRHHIHDVYTHSLLALKYAPTRDPLVRLATLLHDIGKVKTRKVTDSGIVTFYNHEVVGANQSKEIADRLKLSKKQKDKLWIFVRWHQFTVDDKQTDSALRRFIKNVGHENLDDMLALRTGDRLGGGARETSWRLEKFKERLEEVQHQPFSVRDLAINGKDVMDTLKISSGPQVGKILNQLFAEVEEDLTRNTTEYLLKRVKEF